MKKHKNGFTLVELLVVLLVAILILASGSLILSTFVRHYKDISHQAETLTIQQFVLLKISKEIREADQILAISPKAITLKTGKSSLSYDLKDYKVRRIKDGSSQYITEEHQVDNLGFDSPSHNLVIIKVGSFETGAFLRYEK